MGEAFLLDPALGEHAFRLEAEVVDEPNQAQDKGEPDRGGGDSSVPLAKVAKSKDLNQERDQRHHDGRDIKTDLPIHAAPWETHSQPLTHGYPFVLGGRVSRIPNQGVFVERGMAARQRLQAWRRRGGHKTMS